MIFPANYKNIDETGVAGNVYFLLHRHLFITLMRLAESRPKFEIYICMRWNTFPSETLWREPSIKTTRCTHHLHTHWYGCTRTGTPNPFIIATIAHCCLRCCKGASDCYKSHPMRRHNVDFYVAENKKIVPEIYGWTLFIKKKKKSLLRVARPHCPHAINRYKWLNAQLFLPFLSCIESGTSFFALLILARVPRAT